MRNVRRSESDSCSNGSHARRLCTYVLHTIESLAMKGERFRLRQRNWSLWRRKKPAVSLRNSTPDQIRKRRRDTLKKRGPAIYETHGLPTDSHERGQLGPCRARPMYARATKVFFRWTRETNHVARLDWRQDPLGPKRAIPTDLAPTSSE